jgi:AraC family transcriptional regulator of adaptative response/methylated-DNA-[protein]-cysteine methyltransferase
MNGTSDPLPSAPTRARAFAARDRAFDGAHYVAVHTTSIFCRPSCPARRTQPESVRFFASVKEALFAGFRPCRRCHPLAENDAPAWVRRLLAALEESATGRLRDADLRRLGIAPERARRFFQERYGMSFHAYARGRRLGAALCAIRGGSSLDDDAYDTGFASLSGFRDAFAKALGELPGKGPALERIALAWVETPLGPMIAGATDRGLCLLEFSDRRMLETQLATLRRRFHAALAPGEHPHLTLLKEELDEYFAGTRAGFSVPLDTPGSAFEERVWNALRALPCGETVSYEELARRIGAPGAQRAVGTANGKNRVAILVPCHRVVKKDGRVGGYGGGAWRKEWLLARESRAVAPASRLS